MTAVERHDLADGLELVADLLDHRKEFLADEQDLGLGVVHDLQHLGRREPPVDRDHHGIGLGRAEQQLEEQVARLVEMGDRACGRTPSAIRALATWLAARSSAP